MNWSFVIAYYNEMHFLPATLASLGAQTVKPFRLILVDNGSTDGSPELARRLAAELDGIETLHVSEVKEGKIHALETAMQHITTPFVAFGDGDTTYPPNYLAAAERAYAAAGEDLVAVMAIGVPPPPHGIPARWKRLVRTRFSARMWPTQTHTGGYGQTFRTHALLAAGGYAYRFWPYVLMDHEIMQRVLKLGRAVYPTDFWCVPSPRRADRRRVRWTLVERLLYHACPFAWRDRFFYEFLGPRFEARGATHAKLREKTWQQP